MSLRRTQAYDAFKEALFGGKLTPGQFVTQKELCDLLNVSVAPMRDALKDLAAEELVEVMPQVGVRIRHVDRKFVNDAFQLRSFIECEALREIIASGDLGFMAPIYEETKNVLKVADNEITPELLQEAQALDMRMHEGIIAALDNEMIADVHAKVSDRIKVIRLNHRYVEWRLKSALTEHLAVMEACLEGDSERAVAALKNHLAVSRRRSLGIDDFDPMAETRSAPNA